VALSPDFLQGAFEKIHFQCLVCENVLQSSDSFSQSRLAALPSQLSFAIFVGFDSFAFVYPAIQRLSRNVSLESIAMFSQDLNR
jgi:hypothetical protein